MSRAEQGDNPTLLTLLRMLRVYGRLPALETFLPEPEISPMQRLEAVKGVVDTFVAERETDRIGLIVGAVGALLIIGLVLHGNTERIAIVLQFYGLLFLAQALGEHHLVLADIGLQVSRQGRGVRDLFLFSCLVSRRPRYLLAHHKRRLRRRSS